MRTYEYLLPARVLDLMDDDGATERLERFRTALKAFEGAHPFHNYTKRAQYSRKAKRNFSAKLRDARGKLAWEGQEGAVMDDASEEEEEEEEEEDGSSIGSSSASESSSFSSTHRQMDRKVANFVLDIEKFGTLHDDPEALLEIRIWSALGTNLTSTLCTLRGGEDRELFNLVAILCRPQKVASLFLVNITQVFRVSLTHLDPLFCPSTTTTTCLRKSFVRKSWFNQTGSLVLSEPVDH